MESFDSFKNNPLSRSRLNCCRSLIILLVIVVVCFVFILYFLFLLKKDLELSQLPDYLEQERDLQTDRTLFGVEDGFVESNRFSVGKCFEGKCSDLVLVGSDFISGSGYRIKIVLVDTIQSKVVDTEYIDGYSIVTSNQDAAQKDSIVIHYLPLPVHASLRGWIDESSTPAVEVMARDGVLELKKMPFETSYRNKVALHSGVDEDRLVPVIRYAPYQGSGSDVSLAEVYSVVNTPLEEYPEVASDPLMLEAASVGSLGGVFYRSYVFYRSVLDDKEYVFAVTDVDSLDGMIYRGGVLYPDFGDKVQDIIYSAKKAPKIPLGAKESPVCGYEYNKSLAKETNIETKYGTFKGLQRISNSNELILYSVPRFLSSYLEKDGWYCSGPVYNLSFGSGPCLLSESQDWEDLFALISASFSACD